MRGRARVRPVWRRLCGWGRWSGGRASLRGSPAADAGGTTGDDASTTADSGSKHDAGPATGASCFGYQQGAKPSPNYDQFHPTILPSCAGTHHQTITGVQRVVFLGDSVTTGTPPTSPTQFYRALVSQALIAKFGPIQIDDCSAWGARFDDLLAGKGEIAKCFPNAVEPKRTLVIMTNGGNDVAAWAKAQMDSPTAMAAADDAAKLLSDAMHWFKDAGPRFPNGVDVVLSNVYEYTDTSGKLDSCAAATVSGLKGSWPQGTDAVVHFEEQIMKVAVETNIDMVFLLEDFCGHGYQRTDSTLQCYRGPSAPLWFDATCYHPNPDGHAEIARLFKAVIDG
jgi:lysophospholipase L1-like esterase